MRYDEEVYFQKVTSGAYNYESGNYDADTVTEFERAASVSNTTVETMRLVYGEIRQGSKTIQLQNLVIEPFDRVRIGEKIYTVDHRKQHRLKETIVLSEVQ